MDLADLALLVATCFVCHSHEFVCVLLTRIIRDDFELESLSLFEIRHELQRHHLRIYFSLLRVLRCYLPRACSWDRRCCLYSAWPNRTL